jgi:hypothetical protein
MLSSIWQYPLLKTGTVNSYRRPYDNVIFPSLYLPISSFFKTIPGLQLLAAESVPPNLVAGFTNAPAIYLPSGAK